MSASVWFEQVDKGLIEEIKKHVKLYNENGELVPVEHVFVRTPEREFKHEDYPCVSIYNLYEKHDKKRYNPEPVVMSVDKITNTAVVEESAVPFNLYYQIDFWSKYQMDMNKMTGSWLQHHFRYFNLPVVDEGGKPRTCFVTPSDMPRKADFLSNGERVFRTIFSYCIRVELDNETRYNVSIATSTSLDISTIQED